MAVKNTWTTGERVTPADLNALATLANQNEQALNDLGAISDPGDTGLEVVQADTPAQALLALGVGTTGEDVFQAATPALVFDALEASDSGVTVLTGTPEQARDAIGATTAADVVHRTDTSAASIGFVDNDPTLAANSAAKLATQQAIRQYVLAKLAELIGAAPAELDTWLELVAAIQDNEDALAGIITALADRLLTADAPELIRDTIATALVPGTNVTITPNDGANTITISASGGGGGGGTEPLVFSSETGWPSRPPVSYPVFWIGGDAPEDAPPALGANDVWIPATGDNIDLGTILEAFQMIAGTANTIPFLSALNTFGNLLFKTTMTATPSDTAVLSEAAIKTYVDKLPTQPAKTGNYSLVATDRNTCLEYNNTTNATFTIDNHFEAGDVVQFRSINTGILAIAAGTGVTLDVFGGTTFKLAGRWAEASIHFRTATHAILSGNLIA